MSDDTGRAGTPAAAFGALRRFVRAPSPVETCELCGAALTEQHTHLLQLSDRQILCACDPCAILFNHQEGTRFRRVSRRLLGLTDFQLADSRWDELLIPVGMAFFFYNSTEERVVALYPSPAGATESLLSLEAWQGIVADNPVLAGMEPDVEALLVNRIRGRQDYYLAPIDECYRLVGLIRMGWRGLAGGKEVWQQIDSFFAGLEKRCSRRPTPERDSAHA